MINTIGTISERLDDTESLIKAADTASSATSNSEQMPMRNQETGSSVMQIMGEKAKNLASSEDPDQIVNLASKMLDTSGNLFFAGELTSPKVAEENIENITLLVNFF